MLNQFHDVLPGSSIAWVHREAREDYRRDLKRLAEIAQDMCAVLRKANPQADLLAEARISQFRNRRCVLACQPHQRTDQRAFRTDPDAGQRPCTAGQRRTVRHHRGRRYNLVAA